MKKRIALLSACALLISVFSVAMMPVGATAGTPSAFFYSYATESDYSTNVGDALPDQTQAADTIAENLVQTFRADNTYTHRTVAYSWGANAGGNTELSYDATEQAMKITIAEDYTGSQADYPDLETDFKNNKTTINRPGQVTFLAENDINTSMGAYPYFAIMIKLADASYEYVSTSTSVAQNADAAQTFGGTITSDGYRATEDWQLLVLNVSAADVQWRAIVVGLLERDNVAVTAGQEVGWIKWAGAFASEADAEAQFVASGGTIPTEPSEPEVKDYGISDYFIDFSSGVNAQTTHHTASANPFVLPDGNSAVEYDSAIGAMKISTKQDFTNAGDAGRVYYYPGTAVNGKVDMKEYPIFAAKVKIAKTDLIPGQRALLRTSGGNWHEPGLPYHRGTEIASQGYLFEAGEDDWQLILFDAQNSYDVNGNVNGNAQSNYDNGQCITWEGVQFALTTAKEADPDLRDGTPETLGWIQWAGAFKSIEQAEAYFDDTTEEKAEPQIDTDRLVDYSVNYNAYFHSVEAPTVVSGANAAVAYDSVENAIKISTVDNTNTTAIGGVFLNIRRFTGAVVGDYPIVAMKIKLANANNGAFPSALVARAGASSMWGGGTFSAPEATTDWQMVYFDATSLGATTTYGASGYFIQFNNGLTTNTSLVTNSAGPIDLAWIQWVKPFKSVADAELYFEQTVASTQEEPEALAGSGAAIRKTLYNNAQGLRFHHTLNTTIVGDKETVKYNGEDVVVKDVFVLMAAEDTLAALDKTADNLTKDLVGTNAKVQQTAITSCRSRVDDGEGNISYEFTALLTNVKAANAKTYVCARAYLVCEDANGNEVYVYGDTQVTSVYEMYNVLGGAANTQFTTAVHTWMAAL